MQSAAAEFRRFMTNFDYIPEMFKDQDGKPTAECADVLQQIHKVLYQPGATQLMCPPSGSVVLGPT
jgi:hypothetical protein